MRAALALAAARATGSVEIGPSALSDVTATCARIGRRSVGLGGHELAVAWQDGYGPNLDDGTVSVYALPQTTLLALGLALGLCIEPYRRLPGREASLAEFDRALDRLVATRSERERAGGGTAAFIKGALTTLSEIGLLRVEQDTIMLGPGLAEWTDADWTTAEALAARMRETAA